MPNQELASTWIFGNGSVRVGTQGLFRPYLKTFIASFLLTRLTAPGSPRMHRQWSGQSYSFTKPGNPWFNPIYPLYLNLLSISLQASSVSLSSFRFAYFRYMYVGGGGGGRNSVSSPPPLSLESSSEITEGTWTQGRLSPTVNYHAWIHKNKGK